MGVLEHENDTMTFYRSFHNVSKNSNFTIYCLSRQLEKWKNQFNRYPEEVFIQIDGGPENANQFVLAYLELLVARGLTKQIYYTRLPTRHTHEDIDAIFGVVWRWFKNSIRYQSVRLSLVWRNALRELSMMSQLRMF